MKNDPAVGHGVDWQNRVPAWCNCIGVDAQGTPIHLFPSLDVARKLADRAAYLNPITDCAGYICRPSTRERTQ